MALGLSGSARRCAESDNVSVKRNSAKDRRIPTVVTFLDMKAKSNVMAPAPKGKIAILRAENPPVHFYRYLYNTIGEAYCWVDRRKVDDETLAAILGDPLVELYIL